ncbi:SPOR domain-containing protein [Roseovarius salinarum]|uniref:SPOR domain-containing protein n=1 Tax=Roseovarius salinarum TaxID=1981892 RepID=UPI000C3415DC|nr:SPOR domain-containing protein [Roseovarius salinarum]
MRFFRGKTGRNLRAAAVLGSVTVLAGCMENGQFPLFQSKPQAEKDEAGAEARAVKLVERDVEAPEVFQVTDKGLWDGRPSLGGVWVAHPDVTDPERAIIRNLDNGKFVIGALFRRERVSPGPVLQVSSDAAAALDMLAGAPAELNVTALRREEVPGDEAAEEAPTEGESAAAAPVETETLDPVAGASAAIEAAEDTPDDAAEADPEPRPRASLDRPYIQIGIFSIEENARNTATSMRQAGMVPTVKKQSLRGKTFWRVVVGPATSKSERRALLRKIREIGFEDAYAVDS